VPTVLGLQRETAMEERSILIADQNTSFLSEIAYFFKGAGYAVSTTNSAVSVVCDILKKHIPVLLLGEDFDKKIGLSQLLQVLTKCNRHLDVIMVSGEEALPMERTVEREETSADILRSVTENDEEETKPAGDCTF
jgi:DNA-binding NtrC family response regulator